MARLSAKIGLLHALVRRPRSWRTSACRRPILALSLAINGLDAGYGAVKALRGVSLHVETGGSREPLVDRALIRVVELVDAEGIAVDHPAAVEVAPDRRKRA